MVKHFNLPDVGEGLTEADIVKWHVAVGDTVEINQTIVEIETAKAVVELPCPFEGVVTELLVAEGDVVPVGTPIIGVADEAGEEPVAPVEEPKRTPVLVGYGVKAGATKRRARKGSTRPVTTVPAGAPRQST
ncbi:biotin/lipoyl-containing protein, partial [Actinocorallia lasiicapitis]